VVVPLLDMFLQDSLAVRRGLELSKAVDICRVFDSFSRPYAGTRCLAMGESEGMSNPSNNSAVE
jgi:hypothetical protein